MSTGSTTSGRIGVLLVNLGTPDAPTPAAVRRYLAEFLSDSRVVEIPRLAWLPILHGIILNTRPRKSAHAYQQVWTEGGAPLAAITKAQADDLTQRLGVEAEVTWAMRYGNPMLKTELQRLIDKGCDRILFAPLYPQYAGATTASAMDSLSKALGAMRNQPAIRTLPAYYKDSLYIGALCRDLTRQIGAAGFEPQVLLLSYHGMPERTAKLGDPYFQQCQETTRLLRAAMAQAHPNIRVEMSFQSRFGRAKWLEPYTDATLASLAQQGVKRLVIAAPGFSADCLETREELAISGREQFLQAGGEQFAAMDCLNDSPFGMDMLEALVRRELAGWL